jgi:hypothetical protein
MTAGGSGCLRSSNKAQPVAQFLPALCRFTVKVNKIDNVTEVPPGTAQKVAPCGFGQILFPQQVVLEGGHDVAFGKDNFQLAGKVIQPQQVRVFARNLFVAVTVCHRPVVLAVGDAETLIAMTPGAEPAEQLPVKAERVAQRMSQPGPVGAGRERPLQLLLHHFLPDRAWFGKVRANHPRGRVPGIAGIGAARADQARFQKGTPWGEEGSEGSEPKSANSGRQIDHRDVGSHHKDSNTILF